MKRIILLVAAVASLGVVGPAPAAADHHPACTGGPAVQTVTLSPTGSNLDFGGSVRCLGAESAAITALTITPLAGTPTTATLTGAAACGPCTDTIRASGSIPAAAGLYEVKMNFTVTDAATGRVFNAGRRARFAFSDASGAVKVCGHGATPPNCQV